MYLKTSNLLCNKSYENFNYASSALCALNTMVTATNSTFNFLNHTDESCKDETHVCGYKETKR